MRVRAIRPVAWDPRPLGGKEPDAWIKPWKEVAGPDTQIEAAEVVRGVESLESFYDAEMAAPFILQQVEKAEREGMDAVIIHCMADPALRAARENANIPVLGEGLACFLTAIGLGDRFSIIDPLEQGARVYEQNLRAYGLIDHLASIRALGIPVAELRNDLGALKEAFLEQARKAVETDGAHVIVPGCGRIYGLSSEFSDELGVPVLDPLATAVAYAEMLVKLSLTCSKKAYPNPPVKRREI